METKTTLKDLFESGNAYTYDLNRFDKEVLCVFKMFREWIPLQTYFNVVTESEGVTLKQILRQLVLAYAGYTMYDGLDRDIFRASIEKTLHMLCYKMLGDESLYEGLHHDFHDSEKQIIVNYKDAVAGARFMNGIREFKTPVITLLKEGLEQPMLVPDVKLPGGPTIRQCDYTFCINATEPEDNKSAGRHVCDGCNGVFCKLHQTPVLHNCPSTGSETVEPYYEVNNRERLIQPEGSRIDGLTGQEWVPKTGGE